MVATLSVSVDPADAAVLLNGVLVATPLRNADVLAGNIRIKASRQGYAHFDKTYTLKPGKSTHTDIRLRKAYGRLNIRSDPQPAAVSLNGKFIGKTWVRYRETPVGTYNVRLWAPYHHDTVITGVQVSRNKVTKLFVRLIPQPGYASTFNEYRSKKGAIKTARIVTTLTLLGTGVLTIHYRDQKNKAYDEAFEALHMFLETGDEAYSNQALEKAEEGDHKKSLMKTFGYATIGLAVLDVVLFLVGPSNPMESFLSRGGHQGPWGVTLNSDAGTVSVALSLSL